MVMTVLRWEEGRTVLEWWPSEARVEAYGWVEIDSYRAPDVL